MLLPTAGTVPVCPEMAPTPSKSWRVASSALMEDQPQLLPPTTCALHLHALSSARR